MAQLFRLGRPNIRPEARSNVATMQLDDWTHFDKMVNPACLLMPTLRQRRQRSRQV